MRIACLQFAPQVGDVDNNLNRADAVLNKANPQDLDLLVLPELAFSGYNFKSLQHISPFLEPTTSGITSLWARTTALKYDCNVTVGYPEKVDISPKWPASPEYYNSAITVNREGETIANYRKSFLYYTDETWALEGPDGFFDGEIDGLGNVAMGICKWPTKSFERMDLNPYKFESPWSAWEFAYHILHKQANLVILSMAWLTREDPRSFSRSPKEPDMETLSYWLARLEPVIRAETEGEIIVVLANRTGVEDDAVYAGTSAVLGINGGEVKVYGILGRGERELLVVDTNKKPKAKLVSEPNSAASNISNASTNPSTNPSTISRTSDRSDTSVRTDNTDATSACLSPTSPTMAPSNPCSPLSPATERERTPTQKSLGLDKTKHDFRSPVTPADSMNPSAFFAIKGPHPDEEKLREQLKSSIPQPDFKAPSPDSPTFKRPESPKSRNASRTRQPIEREPALVNHDLAEEPQPATIPRVASPPQKPVSPLQPKSASDVPNQYQSSFTSNSLGPRSMYIAPRPSSTIW
ncbi:carbon-nitrogen hydrolase [Halenospora varia]|nr:carbon-nitrogen hydrolase [Halenospora varia]